MKNTLIGIATVTLLLACDSKSPSTPNSSANQTASVSCKNFGVVGSDQYADNLVNLIQLSGWNNGKTSIEEFALGLCEGDTKGPDSFVKFGHITPMQAIKIASLLGISYNPPPPAPDPVVNTEPQSIKPIGPYCGKITGITQYVADQIGKRYNTDARDVNFDYANEANPQALTCTVRLQTRVGPKFCGATEIWLIGNQYVASGMCR